VRPTLPQASTQPESAATIIARRSRRAAAACEGLGKLLHAFPIFWWDWRDWHDADALAEIEEWDFRQWATLDTTLEQVPVALADACW